MSPTYPKPLLYCTCLLQLSSFVIFLHITWLLFCVIIACVYLIIFLFVSMSYKKSPNIRRSFRRSMSSSCMHTATFSTEKTKVFHQIQVYFDDFGKVQHNFFTKPPKGLNKFWCYINIHFITSRRGKILEHSKIPCLSFSLPIVKFWHKCAEGVNEIDDCPSPYSFRLNLLSCWNMSASYTRRKIK